MSIPKPPFRVIQHELVETWPMKGCKVKSQVTKAHIKLSKGWYLLLIFVLFINFLLVFTVVFSTKEKKKKTYKGSLWKEEAQFKILYKPPSCTIQEHPFCRKNMQGTKPAIQIMLRNRGFGQRSVCFIVALWSIFRQRGKKMPDSISAVRTLGPRLQRVSWSILRNIFPGLVKLARCFLWWQNPVTLGFSWCDSVGGFSGSTLPPFQLGMQFGFHRHCQQPRLCCALIRF